MDLGRYSKLIGALAGNGVAILLAWLAVQFPAIATCAPMPVAVDTTAAEEICSVLGFDQTQITAALMLLFNTYFVYAFPANKPPA